MPGRDQIGVSHNHLLSGVRIKKEALRNRRLCHISADNYPSVGQCFQEGDDRLLLRRCQAEVAHLTSHDSRALGCGSVGAGYVAGVVEVDDLFEALEVAVVAVSLHEAGARRVSRLSSVGTLNLPSSDS